MRLSIKFNISSDLQFDAMSVAIGQILKSLADKAGTITPYKDQLIYDPLQIGLTGQPKTGKSALITNAVKAGFADTQFDKKEKTVKSHDQTRDIKVWKRWIADSFEIRMQDQRAISALPYIANELPNFERRGIRIFEHVYDELKPLCELLMHLENADNGAKYLHLKAKENTDIKTALETIIPTIQDLRV